MLFADGFPRDQDEIMDSATAGLLAEAIRLHRQGALGEAAERYVQVLRNEPTNADVLYALAQIACHQGRFAEGVDFSQRALAIDPHRARAQRPPRQRRTSRRRGGADRPLVQQQSGSGRITRSSAPG